MMFVENYESLIVEPMIVENYEQKKVSLLKIADLLKKLSTPSHQILLWSPDLNPIENI